MVGFALTKNFPFLLAIERYSVDHLRAADPLDSRYTIKKISP